MNVKIPYKITDKLKFQLIDYCHQPDAPWEYNGVKHQGYVINKQIRFGNLDTPLAKKVYDFSENLYHSLGFTVTETDHELGDCLGVAENNGYVQIHKDEIKNNFKNLHNLRFNFMLVKPTIGGMPVIQGQEYQIEEDEAWMIVASMWMHGHTKVVGDRPRVTLGIGRLVESKALKQFLQKHL